MRRLRAPPAPRPGGPGRPHTNHSASSPLAAKCPSCAGSAARQRRSQSRKGDGAANSTRPPPAAIRCIRPEPCNNARVALPYISAEEVVLFGIQASITAAPVHGWRIAKTSKANRGANGQQPPAEEGAARPTKHHRSVAKQQCDRSICRDHRHGGASRADSADAGLALVHIASAARSALKTSDTTFQAHTFCQVLAQVASAWGLPLLPSKLGSACARPARQRRASSASAASGAL
jgi:hypothetical protein